MTRWCSESPTPRRLFDALMNFLQDTDVSAFSSVEAIDFLSQKPGGVVKRTAFGCDLKEL